MVSLGEFKQLDDSTGLVYVVDVEKQSFKWTRVNLRSPPAQINVASFDDVLELRLPTEAIGQVFVPSGNRTVYYVLTAMDDVIVWQLAGVDDADVQTVSIDNAMAYIDMADGYSDYESEDESDYESEDESDVASDAAETSDMCDDACRDDGTAPDA